MSTPPYHPEYRNTPLWRAVASAVRDLQASKEISVATAQEYVIDHLCRELAAKGIVAEQALQPAPGR